LAGEIGTRSGSLAVFKLRAQSASCVYNACVECAMCAKCAR
jgi:hypothetical protein